MFVSKRKKITLRTTQNGTRYLIIIEKTEIVKKDKLKIVIDDQNVINIRRGQKG